VTALDRGPRWLATATLIGALYLAISLASSALASGATSDGLRFFWRLSAFIVSGVMLVAHVAYEHLRLRSTVRLTAWHATVAAALGGLGLAMAANLHDLGSATGYRPRMLVALVAWPLLTAAPAFVAAMAMAAVLDRWRAHDRGRP